MEHYYRLTLYRKDGSVFIITDIHHEVNDVRRALARVMRELLWKQEGTFIFQSHNGYIECCYTDVTGFTFVRI